MQRQGALLIKPNSITLASSKLAPNMFEASSELASVMEFALYQSALECSDGVMTIFHVNVAIGLSRGSMLKYNYF